MVSICFELDQFSFFVLPKELPILAIYVVIVLKVFSQKLALLWILWPPKEMAQSTTTVVADCHMPIMFLAAIFGSPALQYTFFATVGLLYMSAWPVLNVFCTPFLPRVPLRPYEAKNSRSNLFNGRNYYVIPVCCTAFAIYMVWWKLSGHRTAACVYGIVDKLKDVVPVTGLASLHFRCHGSHCRKFSSL